MTARRILAFDTAGAACSAAVWGHDRILARLFEPMTRGQSERLVPMIQEVMASAALDFRELEAIAVTRGPGGFTGVRIGLATARGLALACGRPLLGLSNFEAVAASVPEPERCGRRLAVLIDARRLELYMQIFDEELAPYGAPSCVAPAGLRDALPAGPLVLAGDAVDQGLAGLAGARGKDITVCRRAAATDAAEVARLAAARPLPAAGAAPPAPLYLRPPDVGTIGAGPPGVNPPGVSWAPGEPDGSP
ncbi:MAG: tRNA (adenosine(37)-N6)-threonylcarbamoyltransferase complex dimerization subunit type 1 TsaB [Rhodospirillales bacterium]|nr:tRNA (adenosine(37)-N6)-threonylcarbamoyltransferase complex dimerization subunit type 1 TsaB [Rhodospirillales bacterium]